MKTIMPQQPQAAEEISGEIVKIRSFTETWFAGEVYDGRRNRSVSGVTGVVPPVGSTVVFTGSTVFGQYGPEFKIKTVVSMEAPKGRSGAIAFLETIDGISKVRSRLIVNALGENAISMICDDPACLARIPGFGVKLVASVGKQLVAKKATIECEVKLLAMKLSTAARRRVVDLFGNKLTETIERNPYALTVVDGVTFSKVDDWVIRSGKFASDSLERGSALIVESLKAQAESGHTYQDQGTIMDGARKLRLTTPFPHSRLDASLEFAVANRMVALRPEGFGLFSLVLAEERIHNVLMKWMAEPSVLGDLSLVPEVVRAILTDEQRSAVESAVNNRVSILTGGPGVGKCLKPGTPILMFDGSIRKIEDIREGDLVMGDDSTPRTVKGLSHGWSDMFEVVPVKGDPFSINENHILTFVMQQRKTFRSGQNKVEVSDLPFDVMDLPVRQYLTRGKRFKEKAKLLRVAVNWPGRPVPMDPYFLGIWLGDGTNIRPEITTPDQEVIDFLHEFAACYEHVQVFHRDDPERPYSYALTVGKRSRRNPIRGLMRSLDLFENKHIPEVYKVNDEDTRMQVLAGLIDSDGHLARGTYEIITVYEKLRDDILFLARSLGFAAYWSIKKVRGYEDTDYYRICISGDLSRVPVKIARKKAGQRQQIKNVLHTGFKVEPAGHGEYYGIEVDGNHRHLLGDFTVVHNTFCSKAVLAAFPRTSIAVVAPTGKAAKRAQEVTGLPAMTIHRFIGTVSSRLHDPKDNADPEVVIPQVVLVDEASMVDVELFSSLLHLLDQRTGARVVIVGDVDQLPSVGPGQVLFDLIACDKVPMTRLTKVMRQQGAENQIVDNAYLINNGQLPDNTSRPHRQWLFGEAKEIDRIHHWITTFLGTRVREMGFDPIKDVQVLTGQRQRELGCEGLNVLIRECLNPRNRSKTEITKVVDGRTVVMFREGDKVMNTENNQNLGIVNGDQGIVQKINLVPDRPGETTVDVLLDSGERVTFRSSELGSLVQAWAVTVHKSQGSEYPVVVVICHDSLAWSLQRALLYTAVTRAKKHLVLFGTESAIQTAVRKERDLRMTRLIPLFKEAHE